jgi:hypothetical protein
VPKLSIEGNWQNGIFGGQDFLDIQDRVSYTSLHKKEVLIKPELHGLPDL